MFRRLFRRGHDRGIATRPAIDQAQAVHVARDGGKCLLVKPMTGQEIYEDVPATGLPRFVQMSSISICRPWSAARLSSVSSTGMNGPKSECSASHLLASASATASSPPCRRTFVGWQGAVESRHGVHAARTGIYDDRRWRQPGLLDRLDQEQQPLLDASGRNAACRRAWCRRRSRRTARRGRGHCW